MKNPPLIVLPPYREEWSDGCSFAPDWWPEIRQCCVAHDQAYYYGGSAQARREADRAFYHCLVVAGMPRWMATVYYGAVRVFGSPKFHLPKVSWAFGGRVFAYTARSAAMEPESPCKTKIRYSTQDAAFGAFRSLTKDSESDHFLGYYASHHEHVQVACSRCHRHRAIARGGEWARKRQ